jgi:hypothetical protein
MKPMEVVCPKCSHEFDAHADSPLPETYNGYDVCNAMLLSERSRNWTGRTRATVDPERDRGAGILGQMNAPGSWPVADS